MGGGGDSMMKTCVILDGKIINVGPWDDKDGTNPLPEGAVIEEREFVEIDGGLYPADYTPPKSPQEQVQELQLQNGELLFKLAFAQDDLQKKSTQMGMMLMQLATIQGGV
jgi:hypothetical protein